MAGAVDEEDIDSVATEVPDGECTVTTLQGEVLRVAPLEHLLAVAIRLQRGKDKVRLAKAFTGTPDKVDFNRLEGILSRHKLLERMP